MLKHQEQVGINELPEFANIPIFNGGVVCCEGKCYRFHIPPLDKYQVPPDNARNYKEGIWDSRLKELL